MATATVQIPATGTYRIDPASSSVSFTTRHLFGLGAVKGTFGVLSGEVTIADPVTASTARAVIDAASFSGGHPQRDSPYTCLAWEAGAQIDHSLGGRLERGPVDRGVAVGLY